MESDLVDRHNQYYPPGQIFPHGSNFLIGGGHFSSVQGDYHYNVNGATGLQILSQQIAAGASFDSCQRSPPGKCHPGTRENAIKIIKDWILDPAPTHKVAWLYGPAGSGKSALAQSMAELLWEHYRDRYGGSFFFAAGDKLGRRDGSKLFSTLAYQLAVQFPSILPFINNALLADPTLPTKSMDVQMKALIIDPILKAPSWPPHTPTIIIDGLDECGDSNSQTTILSLISQSFYHHNIPLRFLVVSRPEYWIRDSFEVGPLKEITMPISLNDVGDADRDIETYLVAEFADICKKYNRIMASVEQPWPPARIIRRFVWEASGQFIYASTIVRFIGHSSDFCNPPNQLRILTTSDPHRASAFSNLDALYASILSRIPENYQAALKIVLGGAMLELKMQAVESVFGIAAGEVALILDGLSSLVAVRYEDKTYEDSLYEDVMKQVYGPSGEPEVSSIHFYHLSFPEFLENESRSGKYFIAKAAIADRFLHAFCRLLMDALAQKSEIETHPTYTMGMFFTKIIVMNAYHIRPTVNVQILDYLKQAMELFLSSVSAPIRYSFYLLRCLHILRRFKLDSTNLMELVKRTECKIMEFIGDSNMAAITPTLCYSWIGYAFGVKVKDLKMLREVNILSDVRHHCLFEDISPDCVQPLNALHRYISNGQGEWLARWNSQAMRLMGLCLTILANDGIKFAENPQDLTLLPLDVVQLRRRFLTFFFFICRDKDFSISAILQNAYGKLFLRMILDIKVWFGLQARESEEWWELPIHAMLWLHELMQDPVSRAFLLQYDDGLPDTMSRTLTGLYHHSFLPLCQKYLTELFTGGLSLTSFSLYLRPTSDGKETHELDARPSHIDKKIYVDEMVKNVSEFQQYYFGDRESAGLDDPIISRESWYPYLATYLLILEARDLYYRLNPIEWHNPHMSRFKRRQDFVPCLFYTSPTEQNLNALRALRILSRRLTPPFLPWYPPTGFRSVIQNLLLQYDNSAITAAESCIFEAWLSTLVEKDVDNAEEDADCVDMSN